MDQTRKRLGPWQWIFLSLLGGGAAASLYGAMRGLGRATNLNDTFPWGIGSGLNVFCGLALATGGYCVAAAVYIFGWRNDKAVRRVALLIGFGGYMTALLGVIATLGRPAQIRPLLAGFWNSRSVLAGTLAFLLLFVLIFALEFAPEIFSHFRRVAPSWLPSAEIPLLLLAAVISILHEAVLARLIVVSQGRFSPLWASPSLLPMLLISSVCACLAVIIFASRHAAKRLGRALSPSQVAAVGKALAILLFLYLVLRLQDFLGRGMLTALLEFHSENYLLGLELSLFLAPLLLLADTRRTGLSTPARAKTARSGDPGWAAYLSAILVIGGFVTNRLNTAITSLEAASHASYFPKWPEVLIAYGIAAWGVGTFAVALNRLPVLPARTDSFDSLPAAGYAGADT